MKSSLMTLVFFLLGCLVGTMYMVEIDVHEISIYVLYFLMLLIGLNLGGNQNFKEFFSALQFKVLLVPVATVTGTFLFSAVAAFFLSRWSVFDCMAVGSGFACYSVSSVLITQLKTTSIGVQLATELGTIALLSNIFRELFSLISAPLTRKYFGYFAPISAAGVGSSDIALQMVAKYSGKEAIPIAVIHGLIINISIPFFVSLFCQL